MTLTKEEKAALELQLCESKVRCREVWDTICQLQKMLKSYRKEHNHWKARFEQADRKLAEEERLTVVTKKDQPVKDDGLKLLINLDRTQLIRIAETLGIEIEDEPKEVIDNSY